MSNETPARPLRADAARNRALILKAAGEVFAERGLQATLDDIARHAGLGTGTVYRRFRDREAIVEALFVERIDDAVAMAERCLADPDPWHGLVTMLETTCALLAVDRGMREVMLSSAYGQNHVATARARMVPLATALIERAQAAGVLRPGIRSEDIPLIFLMMSTIDDFAGDSAIPLWRRFFVLIIDGLRTQPGPDVPLPVGFDQEQVTHAMAGWRPAARR
ncbi:TetR/AcrR family transcriptional regulator [Acidothermaceae bacterium B102]|nr:TetR/AcrR family transcriptional regulator [Acidothermaceae bacterium B102]